MAVAHFMIWHCTPCILICRLQFGISPAFPKLIAVGAGLILAIVVLYFLSRWSVNSRWNNRHTYSIIFGTMVGAMIIGFIGFIYDLNKDFYFKLITNIIATVLFIIFWKKVNKSNLPYEMKK